jgi:hypothetical protein
MKVFKAILLQKRPYQGIRSGSTFNIQTQIASILLLLSLLISIRFLSIRLRRTLRFAILSGILFNSANTFGDDVVIVVHKDNLHVIDFAYVAKIYSGTVRSWPDGTPVIALDQAEDTEVRAQFSAKVMNRSVAGMKAIWSQNVFSGKGLPPKVVGVDSDVKRIISTNRNAIGYLLASQVDATVKVLTK